MKKGSLLFLSVLLCFSLAACAESGSDRTDEYTDIHNYTYASACFSNRL